MSQADVVRPFSLPGRFPRLAWEIALGFIYWLAFLLVLEPGNILDAIHDRYSLAWDQETIRIIGASALGAAATPLVLALVRRYPIEGETRWRNALVQLFACLGVAAGLILLSCILAPLVLKSETRPFLHALQTEMTVNGPLLVFCVAALIGIAHAVRFADRARQVSGVEPVSPTSGYLTNVAIKTRGKLSKLELDGVSWIETQGNYLALHEGKAVHLIRQTSVRFEAMLDPQRFVRIHRQAIVAIAHIRDMTTLPNGDALMHLKDGTELRVSRNFRDSVRAKFEGAAA